MIRSSQRRFVFLIVIRIPSSYGASSFMRLCSLYLFMWFSANFPSFYFISFWGHFWIICEATFYWLYFKRLTESSYCSLFFFKKGEMLPFPFIIMLRYVLYSIVVIIMISLSWTNCLSQRYIILSLQPPAPSSIVFLLVLCCPCKLTLPPFSLYSSSGLPSLQLHLLLKSSFYGYDLKSYS